MNSASYTRLYPDELGESPFEELSVELIPTEFAPPAAPLNTAPFLGATGTVWVGAPFGWGGDTPHPAPVRQIFITTQGEYEITASDGESRKFPVGSVLLLEDTSGKGHSTRMIDKNGSLVFGVVLAEQ